MEHLKNHRIFEAINFDFLLYVLSFIELIFEVGTSFFRKAKNGKVSKRFRRELRNDGGKTGLMPLRAYSKLWRNI